MREDVVVCVVRNVIHNVLCFHCITFHSKVIGLSSVKQLSFLVRNDSMDSSKRPVFRATTTTTSTTTILLVLLLLLLLLLLLIQVYWYYYCYQHYYYYYYF